MDIAIILSIVIAGICTGGIYGLVSCAFSFQFGSLNIVNFAYGSFIMLGMFFSYTAIRDLGIHPVIFCIFAIILYFFLGYVVRILFLGKSDHNVQVMVTVGLSMILQNLALFIWGSLPRTLITTVAPTWVFHIGGSVLVVNQWNIFILLLAAVMLIGFNLFLKKTWTGMCIRAVVQQREASYLMGVDANRTINIAFGLSFVMLAIASMMLSMLFTIEPMAGEYYQIISFFICLIAGVGNLKGAFFAGLLVGVVSSIISLFAAAWHDPIIFGLFILVLTFFPHGIFKSKKSLTRAV